MKNKIKITVIFLYFFLLNNFPLIADEINFESSQIEILENGNLIKAENNAEVSIGSILLNADKLIYDRSKLVLLAEGNVKILDQENEMVIIGKKIFYYKDQNKFFVDGDADIRIKNEYKILSKNIFFNKDLMKIETNEKTTLSDKLGNKFFVEKFKYLIAKKIIRGKKIKYTDNVYGSYFLDDGMIDLNIKKLLGKDAKIDFNNNLLGNTNNEPRIRSATIYHDEDKTMLEKGSFTTCKKTDKCPPWVIQAESIEHDKKKKTLNYKNAWLKLYDVPVVYFPRFFHPDPTVKRQSGFLVPGFYDSKLLGSSIEIPYYKVISDNSDLTFKPRLFFDNEIILQSEYRFNGRKSENKADFSYSNANEKTKTHLFSNSKIDLDLDNFSSSNLGVKIQKSQDNTYLKTYKIESTLIDDISNLNSSISFDATRDKLYMDASFEVYEDLSQGVNSDKYEYIYPNFNIEKIITTEEWNANLLLKTSGHQKKYNTNTYEALFVNDFLIKGLPIYRENGFKNNYNFLFKNVNTNADNSLSYKNENDTKLLSSFSYQSSYPMKKNTAEYNQYLTPIADFKYSPNKTKNIVKEKRKIGISNVYSFERIGTNESVEGGESLTIGAKYKLDKKNSENLFEMNLATVLRVNENDDLPISSTIGKKMSDVFASVKASPNEIININYDFSIDNDLKTANYHSIKTNLSLNNFITTFEFMEENNDVGNESFLSNKTSYNFDDTNSISFGTRKNKETNVTEYYNLIYEYKNDCLIAAVEYNKEYYSDNDLRPEEQLFFSITLVPFGEAKGPSIN